MPVFVDHIENKFKSYTYAAPYKAFSVRDQTENCYLDCSELGAPLAKKLEVSFGLIPEWKM